MPRYNDDDDYDFDRPRDVGQRKRRKRNIRLPNVWWFLAGVPVAFLLLSLLIGGFAGDLLVTAVSLFAALACVAGCVWLLIVALSDSVGQLLLCLFVPFYILFYTLSNFGETRNPFLLYLFGLCGLGLSSGVLRIHERSAPRATAETRPADPPVAPPKLETPKQDPPKTVAPKSEPPKWAAPLLPPKKDEPKADDFSAPARPFAVDPQAKAAGKTVYLAVLTPFAYQTGPWKLGIGARGDDGKGPIALQKREYKYGISMHPPQAGACRVSFVPGREFKRFRGWAGIGDGMNPFGSVVFAAYGDGRKVWESVGFNKSGAAVEFDIDVTGVEVLTLETRMKDGRHHAAHAVWLDPWLER